MKICLRGGGWAEEREVEAGFEGFEPVQEEADANNLLLIGAAIVFLVVFINS